MEGREDREGTETRAWEGGRSLQSCSEHAAGAPELSRPDMRVWPQAWPAGFKTSHGCLGLGAYS